MPDSNRDRPSIHKNNISRKQSKNWWLNCISCSEAAMTTQMQGFGINEPDYEQGLHAFSGGFMHLGYACGLLSGAALTTGFLARTRFEDEETIIEATLYTTIQLAKAHHELTGSNNCRDITNVSLTKLGGRLKYLQQGKGKMCGCLHIKWAPQAHDLIEKSFAEFEKHKSTGGCANCAVRTLKKMVNSGIVKNEDSVLVAGLAGGVGLTGNVCGALAAGVYVMATNHYLSKKSEKRDSQFKGAFEELFGIHNRGASGQLYSAFKERFGSELCVKICKKQFNDISDHSSFIRNGGCDEVTDHIANWIVKESRK